MYIDSHAHLTDSEVIGQISEVLQRARDKRVDTVINICTDVQTLKDGIELAKQYPWIYNAAATTPHDVEKEGESFFPIVKAHALAGKLVAIGETGLDYFYEHSNRAVQQEFLKRYFELALEANLPIIFHCRDAFEDLFTLADRYYKNSAALLHCFTGTMEEAKEVLARGWMISFSGIVTFKKSEALREVIKHVPLDRFVVETDTPYLAPQSKRGQKNEPSFLPETVALIAQLKGVEESLVAKASSDNAIKFFSFSKHRS
jgi:TatD DNase family protein